MKALTLTQPWATLVAIGAKKIETRPWNTNYRGPLAIHAAKGFPRSAKEMVTVEPFARVLIEAGIIHCEKINGEDKFWSYLDAFPVGSVIAVCELKAVIQFRERNSWSELSWEGEIVHRHHGMPPSNQEKAFGDFSPSRWGWLLADIKPLPQPIPARGSLGLWDWEPQP